MKPIDRAFPVAATRPWKS